MFDSKELQEAVNEGLVSVQKHPDANLFIYNYTRKVQYERLWTDLTRKTRGLILDDRGNVVARPFEKFFNLEEHEPHEIPDLPFEVYAKEDGSLAISYWLNGMPRIATRGSFTSDQANHANALLHTKHRHLFSKMDPSATYLFEIIYPENRVVVDYGRKDELVLLTIIDRKTGEERVEDIGFPIVKRYDGLNDIYALKDLQEQNKEGFVVRFSNGFRVKVKFEEYVRLHRLIFGVSTKTIWEYLSQDKELNELLDRVPDEYYDWVRSTEKILRRQFHDIKQQCIDSFKPLNNRKETAFYFQTQKHPSVLFSMLDGKPYDHIIWRMIKPVYAKPFKTET